MYEMKGRVRYSEVDSDGRLTIPALINYLQDCCTFQSEDLGVGLPYLRERGIGWFVTSWWIHVEKLPAMGEHITVKTWPYASGDFWDIGILPWKMRRGKCWWRSIPSGF